MKLKQVSAKNFRSLKEVTLPIHKLTILIGENNAGKSSVLDLLDIMLNDNQPDREDYFRASYEHNTELTADAIAEDVIEIILTFDLSDSEKKLANPYLAILDEKLHFKKVFKPGSSVEVACYTARYADNRLNRDLNDRTSNDELMSFMKELGIKPEGGKNPKKDEMLNLINIYKLTALKVDDWSIIQGSQLKALKNLLPRFDRYRAIDYQTPERLVDKTLRSVYEMLVYQAPEEGQPRRLIESLRNLESDVEISINKKLEDLLVFIKKYNAKVQQINYRPQIDFMSGFKMGEFLIDDGRGSHNLSKTGDGTKRRMLMATLDWDRQVLSEQSTSVPGIIRGYDEPDTNLHYEAQRRMYEAINDIVMKEDSNVQAIVCTHSLTMIDRAPAANINKLHLSDLGVTVVENLLIDEDSEIEDFLHWLAASLGITNTMMFYERCYIIIEGPTEENALPIFYRKLYSRSMIEDGIRLINIEGNGGRKGLLKLLGKNKQRLTLSFLDSDTKNKKIEAEFTEAGFTAEIMKNNTIYIGNKEFEDAFSDETICDCLCKVWPRVDKMDWALEHLLSLRQDADKKKFSDALMGLIRANSEEGPESKKPIFGYQIAKHCPIDKIPTEINELFRRAREIAGLVI